MGSATIRCACNATPTCCQSLAAARRTRGGDLLTKPLQPRGLDEVDLIHEDQHG
jgi:hypothetical protein